MDLLLAFADQAAIALENAALWSENERRKSELEETNRALSTAKADIERLLEARTEELEQAKQQLTKARAELEVRHQRHGIVGQSPAIRRVFAMIERVADSNIPVVVQGESGTGKELVARAIHFGGARKRGPFIALNCAAVLTSCSRASSLATCAVRSPAPSVTARGVRAGPRGTLFLDEFADMPQRMQIDLLPCCRRPRFAPSEPTPHRGRRADHRRSNRPLEKLLGNASCARTSTTACQSWSKLPRCASAPMTSRSCVALPVAHRRAEQDAPASISRDAVERIVASGLPATCPAGAPLAERSRDGEGHTIEADDLPSRGRGTGALATRDRG